MSTHRIHRVWALLLGATALSWWLGDASSPLHRPALLLVFGLAGGKGALIVLDFMELREAPALWRRLLLGWLALVLGLTLIGRLL